jgi:hypothetical protein
MEAAAPPAAVAISPAPVSFSSTASASWLGFDTVVILDAETEAAAHSTVAALRVTCCITITRARKRGWS